LIIGLVAGALVAAAPSNPYVSSNQVVKRHIVQCPDSPTPGTRPSGMECAILVHKRITALPPGPTVWRLETFPSVEAARRFESPRSVIVTAASKIWLMTLGPRRERSSGGTLVAEVGPLPLPSARPLEFLVAEARGRNGITLVHTHSGPEAWYVLGGAQCLETAAGAMYLTIGQHGYVPGGTPMRLAYVGSQTRDAFFVVVHDASRPWNSLSNWHPRGLCPQ
jgi:hypothetical protein